jgi:transmembrane sensor
MSPYESVDPKLFAEAMTWFCRMRRPGEDLEDPYTDSQERQAAFAAWLRASPRNVWAYFQAADHFKALRKHAPPTTTTQARDTMTDKTVHRGLRLRTWCSMGRRFLTFGFCLRGAHLRHKLLAVLAGVAWTMKVALPGSDPLPASCFNEYTTAIGEQRPVPLPDGSTVTLNTNTDLFTCITAQERLVRLARGEAYFNVQHDPRPFRVQSGRGSVQDIGTSFDVYRRPKDTQVSVIEGQVSVSDSAASATPSSHFARAHFTQELHASMQMVIPNAAEVSPSVRTLDAQDITHLIAWLHNSIFLSGLSVTEAIEEIKRYNRVQFAMDDPRIGTLHPGGVMVATHLDNFLETLQNQFGIEATFTTTASGLRIVHLTRHMAR